MAEPDDFAELRQLLSPSFRGRHPSRRQAQELLAAYDALKAEATDLRGQLYAANNELRVLIDHVDWAVTGVGPAAAVDLNPVVAPIARLREQRDKLLKMLFDEERKNTSIIGFDLLRYARALRAEIEKERPNG